MTLHLITLHLITHHPITHHSITLHPFTPSPFTPSPSPRTTSTIMHSLIRQLHGGRNLLEVAQFLQYQPFGEEPLGFLDACF